MNNTSPKKPRNIRLNRELDAKVRKESKRTKLTQTALIEIALERFFKSGGVK